MLFRADENEIKRDTNDDHDLKKSGQKGIQQECNEQTLTIGLMTILAKLLFVAWHMTTTKAATVYSIPDSAMERMIRRNGVSSSATGETSSRERSMRHSRYSRSTRQLEVKASKR